MSPVLPGIAGTVERLEYLADLVLRNADSGIQYLDNSLPVLPPQVNRHIALRIFTGIFDNIPQRHPQQIGVSHNRKRIPTRIDRQDQTGIFPTLPDEPFG